MLEKPDIDDSKILAALRDTYGLRARAVTFLPLGVDVNAAVYRVDTAEAEPFFLKLRRGVFDEMSLAVPLFLRRLGVEQVLAPLETLAGQPWGELPPFRMILYPFIEGRDGYELALTGPQRVALGAALRRVHTAPLPPPLRARLRQETFSPRYREQALAFLAQAQQVTYEDPVAEKLAAFMRLKQAEIARLVHRAAELAARLQSTPLDLVLCHSDLHPGNFLLTNAGDLYIVDWDEPILAPKERDLMHVGAFRSPAWPGPSEEAQFYQGYGPARVDPVALAYYRHERIVWDIAAFCEEVLGMQSGPEDREQAYRYFTGQFGEGGEVEVAFRSDV